jgi:hypothetical protein
MPAGVPVNRDWVVVMPNGEVVIDWGDGWLQNVHSGEFYKQQSDVNLGRQILEKELIMLVRSGKAISYDHKLVYFSNLPERNIKTID